jgi:perosamine synthetase
LEIGPGDEVILADTNWIATCAPIVHLGATPVFVDIDPKTWCIDPDKAEKAITKKTKAIIATHLYGNLCRIDWLNKVIEGKNIALIEDAAEAIGSLWNGKWAGSMGTFGVFSFHGTKTMSTGEGGMLVTNRLRINRSVRKLNNHGRSLGGTIDFFPEALGYKFKISNLQAAMGLAQTERAIHLIQCKRWIFSQYVLGLYGESNEMKSKIVTNMENENLCFPGYWMPTITLTDPSISVAEKKLEQIRRWFSVFGIDARGVFPPLSSLPMFCDFPLPPNERNPKAYDFFRRSMNLPSYHDMTKEEIDIICNIIKEVVK